MNEHWKNLSIMQKELEVCDPGSGRMPWREECISVFLRKIPYTEKSTRQQSIVWGPKQIRSVFLSLGKCSWCSYLSSIDLLTTCLNLSSIAIDEKGKKNCSVKCWKVSEEKIRLSHVWLCDPELPPAGLPHPWVRARIWVVGGCFPCSEGYLPQQSWTGLPLHRCVLPSEPTGSH